MKEIGQKGFVKLCRLFQAWNNRHNSKFPIIPSISRDGGISGLAAYFTQHNQRLLRKARSLSSGRYRRIFTPNGAALERAFSLSAISACRYTWVVSVDSWPSHRAITERSTPFCRSHGNRVSKHVRCDALLFQGCTVLPGSFRMFCQKVLDSFRSERMSSRVGKHGIVGLSVALTEPCP